MPDIELKQVEKSYDGKTKAVASLNLTVNDGDFMCLLGPSGCGKTTTLRMIAGLENTSGGEIGVGNRMLDSRLQGIFVPPEKRNMGLVFQSYALWPHLTIERNTDFGLRLRRVPKQEREERVNRVMATLGIEKYRHRYPAQLSGGQQQRVALARMLVMNPSVLLLDEPLSNLDARLRLEMRTELKRIHHEFGTTIVFVTHDQWEAMTLATRVAVMRDGTLQQTGSPDDIYDHPANAFVAEFVGNPPINMVSLQSENDSAQSSVAREFVRTYYPDVDDATLLGIRPESLKLTDNADSSNVDQLTDNASITAVLPTGGSWIVELNIQGMPFFMTSGSLPLCQAGESVSVYVERNSAHFFDSAQMRIPTRTDVLHRAAR